MKYVTIWRKINDALQGRKADLIMERAVGGLGTIPFREKGINAVYQGINRILIPRTIAYGPEVNIFNPGSIKLVKTPDSPKDLPFLKIPGHVKQEQNPTA